MTPEELSLAISACLKDAVAAGDIALAEAAIPDSVLVERPKKPAPEKELMAWARELAKEGIRVEWEKFMPPRGFQVLPRRWVVERTIAWIDHNRRMSKDYERLPESAEAFIYVAMSRLMLRRLAR